MLMIENRKNLLLDRILGAEDPQFRSKYHIFAEKSSDIEKLISKLFEIEKVRNENCKILKTSLEEIRNRKEDEESKIEEAHSTLKTCCDVIETQKNDILKLVSETTALDEQKHSLLESNTSKEGQMRAEMEKISDLEMRIEQSQEIFAERLKTKEESFETLQSKKKTVEDNREVLQRNKMAGEDAYDCIAYISLLEHHLNSENQIFWKITDFSGNFMEKWDKIPIRISVKGPFDAGKTFVCFGITKRIPKKTTACVHTQGLSMFFSHINKTPIVVADIVGYGCPIQQKEESENQNSDADASTSKLDSEDDQKLNPKAITTKGFEIKTKRLNKTDISSLFSSGNGRITDENFMQNLAVAISDFIVYVMDRLDQKQQKNIFHLIKEMKNQNMNSNACLIVVHNYKELRNLKFLEKYYQEYITDIYDVTRKEIFVEISYFDEKSNKNLQKMKKITFFQQTDCAVLHVVLANHEVLREHNEYVFEFMRNLISNMNRSFQASSYSEMICNGLKRILPVYFHSIDKKNPVFIKKLEDQQEEKQESAFAASCFASSSIETPLKGSLSPKRKKQDYGIFLNPENQSRKLELSTELENLNSISVTNPRTEIDKVILMKSHSKSNSFSISPCSPSNSSERSSIPNQIQNSSNENSDNQRISSFNSNFSLQIPNCFNFPKTSPNLPIVSKEPEAFVVTIDAPSVSNFTKPEDYNEEKKRIDNQNSSISPKILVSNQQKLNDRVVCSLFEEGGKKELRIYRKTLRNYYPSEIISMSRPENESVLSFTVPPQFSTTHSTTFKNGVIEMRFAKQQTNDRILIVENDDESDDLI